MLTTEKTELSDRPAIDGLADRLRDAVTKAGGASAVSRRSGVPLSTLNDYLKGKEARLNRIAALAAACKVSLDWLATGAAPPNTGADIPLLQPEILDAKAHFTALLVVLSVCQEYHQKMHLTPSLREVLIWISNPYVSHRALPDRPVEFKPPQ